MLEPNIMTVANLRAYAQEHGIDLGTAKKKADIVAAIEAAEKQTSEPEVVEAEIIEEEPAGLSVSCTAGTLQANFSALNAYADSILAQFEGWEPSAENIEDVKQCATYRKYLNGLANQVDEKRKFYKNEYLLPLNIFEAECNKVRDKFKAVSNRLNEVEKQADQARKDLKREALAEHYGNYAGLLVDVVPYDRLEDPKWLNKSPVLEKAKLELEAKVDKVAQDWETLKSLGLEYFEQAEVVFFNTLSLGEATSYAAKLKEDAARITAMKAEIDEYHEEPEPEPIPPVQPINQSVNIAQADFESFDSMTYEPEHRAVCPPQPVPVPPPAPAPVAPLSQQIAQALSVYPESLQANVLEALKESQKITNSPMKPYVMIIDAATVEQLKVIGKFCGLVGVTGAFKGGTLSEVASRTLFAPPKAVY